MNRTVTHSLPRWVTRAKKLGLVSLGAAVLAVPTGVANAAPSPEERAAYVVEIRQSVLHLMGYYIGPLAGMARDQLPMDAAVVANNAGRIAQLAPMIPETFSMDTRAFKVETEALDVIWEKQDAFNGKAATLEEKAIALRDLAASGNEDGLRAAIGAMGQACGSCHDDFREEDD